MARLAAALGFHVRVVVDNDDPVADAALIATLIGICEAVIVLPPKTAIERALVAGLTEQTVRDTLEWLDMQYGLGLAVAGLSSTELPKVAAKAIKAKGGLHQPWIDALPAKSSPPIARRVLDSLTAPAPSSKTINVADSP